MPWKIDESGQIMVSEETKKPIFIHSDGKEAEFDADHTLSTITRLNGEAKANREAKELSEQRLSLFEGIEDPDKARQALDTVKNLSAGQLSTAEQVAEMQKQAQKAAEEQVRAASETSNKKIRELSGERDGLVRDLYNEKVGGAFSRSKFINEKISAPLDMLQATFQNRFKIEGGKIVGHDSSGNKIWSRVRNGEIADFDEAMEAIVDSYPYRDNILKGSGATGSGAVASTRGANGGKTMRRADYERLDPMSKGEAARTHEIVD